MVSCIRSLSTLSRLGYMPAHSEALTTAQFSELVLRSLMSPGPRARTNPDALSWPNSWVLRHDRRKRTCDMCYNSSQWVLMAKSYLMDLSVCHFCPIFWVDVQVPDVPWAAGTHKPWRPQLAQQLGSKTWHKEMHMWHSALIWQKEATLQNDISRKWA